MKDRFSFFLLLFQGVLHFQVETEGLSWSYIFGQLERNRAALNIIDYSVSQTTLEQVNGPDDVLRTFKSLTTLTRGPSNETY